MEFSATQPFTNDNMEPITLYGRSYPVVNEVVTIPTTKGSVTVSLNKDGKRKDWYYEVSRGTDHFVMVDFGHLMEALCRIVKEDDLQ